MRLVKEKEANERNLLKSCRQHKDQGEIGTIVNDFKRFVETIDVPVTYAWSGLTIQLVPMKGIIVFFSVELVRSGHAPGVLETHNWEDEHQDEAWVGEKDPQD